MKILGITDGQTSGAAIIEDGRILAAINEERLVRMKHARGAPRASIAKAFELAQVRPEEIDHVAICGINSYFKDTVRGWRGWFEERADIDSSGDFFFRAASRFGGLATVIPGLKELYYLVRTPIYVARRRRWVKVLAQEFGVHAPVRYFHHHYCHAAGAYFTSGFNQALVVTLDGGGDGHSSHVYQAHGGQLRLLHSSDSFDSLGNYYAYVTALCGYRAKKHEGKITGLAAHGQPLYYDYLRSLIDVDDGRLINKGRVLFDSALERMRRELPRGWKKEDLAASIQQVAEDIVRDYVSYWLEQTGEHNVAVAGGVFANVRINQEINELPQVDKLVVHPGMSDEGLGLGAALALWGEERGVSGSDFAAADSMLSDVYFGRDIDDGEIQAELASSGLDFEKAADIERRIAELLAAGFVVARVNGPMEYGPRALGNRSILYHPTDRSVNDWLNKNLSRTEFMPFAPSTLWEQASLCYQDMQGGADTARFMTITFDCTPWMVENCPGVVHIDGTARPQLVRREDNPSYYRIIEEFYALTGLPTVINTSFNIHGEPIVCNARDALRAFQAGHLDYLAIGSYLVNSAAPLTHDLIPVRRVRAKSSTEDRLANGRAAASAKVTGERRAPLKAEGKDS